MKPYPSGLHPTGDDTDSVRHSYMPETRGKSLEKIDETFEGSPVAITWPGILQSRGAENLRNRRPSRRRSSALNEDGRPVFPARMVMERLGSSPYMDSAIEE